MVQAINFLKSSSGQIYKDRDREREKEREGEGERERIAIL